MSSSKNVIKKPPGPLQPANLAEMVDPKQLQWLCCLKVQSTMYRTTMSGLPDTNHMRRQLLKKAKIKSENVRRFEFIHNCRYLEVICTQRVLEKILEYLKIELGGTPIQMGSWIKFIKSPGNKSLFKNEILRLKEDMFDVSLSIFSETRYENDVTKLLGILCGQFDTKFNYKVHMKRVKTQIEEEMVKKVPIKKPQCTITSDADDDEMLALMTDLNSHSVANKHKADKMDEDLESLDLNTTPPGTHNDKKRKLTDDSQVLISFNLTKNGHLNYETCVEQSTIYDICETFDYTYLIYNLKNTKDLQQEVIGGSSITITTCDLIHTIKVSLFEVNYDLFVPSGTLAGHIIPPLYCDTEKYSIKIDNLPMTENDMLLDDLKSVTISLVNSIQTYLCEKSLFLYNNEFKLHQEIQCFKYFDKCLSIVLNNIQIFIYFIFWCHLLPTNAFKVQFGGQSIILDEPVHLVQDIAISLSARGIAAGNIIYNGDQLPMGETITPEHSGSVYYKLKTPNELTTVTTKNRSLRILGWNICGIKHNVNDLLAIIQAFDLDLLFLSECKVAHDFKLPTNFIYYNKSNSPYGCAVVYNSERYSSGDINIIGSEYHLLLKLESVDILYVYRKLSTNCVEWYHSIRPMISNQVFLFGDINVNTLLPLNVNQLTMFDLMAMDGLFHFDIVSDYSFLRNGAIGYPDLAFYKTQTSYKVISGEFMDRFDISDHKAMIFELELDTENVVIFPKMPRWNVKKLKDEQVDFIFKHEEDLEIIKDQQVIEQYLLEFDNDNVPGHQRYSACTSLGDKLVTILHKSANHAIGKSKLFHGIDTQVLQDATTARLRGNHDIANRIIDLSRRLAIKKYKQKVDDLDSCQFLKVVNLASRRKGVSKQHLNRLRLEHHFAQWDGKWDMKALNHDVFIPVKQTNSIWSDYTFHEFNTIIKNLPGHKASGPDDVPNELLKHSNDRFKMVLLRFFNIIGKTGIVPDIFRFSSIIPIHKGKSDDYESMTEYRPIGLCSILRKMFEKLFKPRLMPFLQTGENQFGFKHATSLLDAAWYFESKLIELQYNIDDYIMVKGDLKAAFDSCSHESLLEMCRAVEMPENFISLIINLNLRQNIKLTLGDQCSNYKSINQGVIQGTILSPNLFTKLVDWIMNNFSLISIWFADDLLFIVRRSEYEAKMAELVESLAKIGLKFNMAKTHPITQVFEKWIGLELNHLGTNTEQQIKANLKKARNRIRNARNSGVFNGGYKKEHLLRYIGSAVLPLLEMGLAIHEPISDLAAKVDVFINTTVRDLVGIPIHTPVDDIRFLTGYCSFMDRWTSIKVKFINKLNYLSGSMDDLEYRPKAKMSFSLNKKLKKYIKTNSSILRVFKRSYPNAVVNCNNCSNNHDYANQVYKCHNSLISQPTAKCNRFEGKTILSFPNQWKSIIQQKQSTLQDEELLIVTDASLHENPEIQSTGAAVVLSKSNIHIKAYNLNTLRPDDSTRCEIAAIVCILKDISKLQQYQNYTIHLLCDNTSAIKLCEKVRDKTVPFYNIYSIDLIKEVLDQLNRVTFEYLPGHDDENPDSLNHLCDYFTHAHDIASQPPIELRINDKWKQTAAPSKEVFRLAHVVSSHTNENVLLEIFREIHSNCIPAT
eukprot:NODE_397_length_8118_cov_0.510787.p1 type:complete len:1622 gc:universal NODE_397_length_8118_cov_0.510787:1248-6113(+)